MQRRPSPQLGDVNVFVVLALLLGKLGELLGTVKGDFTPEQGLDDDLIQIIRSEFPPILCLERTHAL